MQDKLMQAQTQPFIKLAQGNMELISRFSSSPEITAQATSFFQQTTEASKNLMQSGAFAQMMQGMLKNYSEFLAEFSQSSMALFSQGQAVVAHQVEDATNEVIDAADVRGRRARQSA